MHKRLRSVWHCSYCGSGRRGGSETGGEKTDRLCRMGMRSDHECDAGTGNKRQKRKARCFLGASEGEDPILSYLFSQVPWEFRKKAFAGEVEDNVVLLRTFDIGRKILLKRMLLRWKGEQRSKKSIFFLSFVLFPWHNTFLIVARGR